MNKSKAKKCDEKFRKGAEATFATAQNCADLNCSGKKCDKAFQKGAIAAGLCVKNEDHKTVTEERDECLARTTTTSTTEAPEVCKV